MAKRKVGKILGWIGGLLLAGLAAASMWFWFTPVGLNNYVNKITLQLTADSPQILTQLGFIDNTPFDFHSGKLDDQTKAHEDECWRGCARRAPVSTSTGPAGL